MKKIIFLFVFVLFSSVSYGVMSSVIDTSVVTSLSGNSSWGLINGTLSDQSDLWLALQNLFNLSVTNYNITVNQLHANNITGAIDCTNITGANYNVCTGDGAGIDSIYSGDNYTYITNNNTVNINVSTFDDRYFNTFLQLFFWNTTSPLNSNYTVMNTSLSTFTMKTVYGPLPLGETVLAKRLFTERNISFISNGQYRQHTTINITNTGIRTIRLHSELYKYNATNGNLIQIGSSVASDPLLANTYQDVEWSGSIFNDTYFHTDEYLVMILNATVSGGGVNPNIELIVGDGAAAHLEIGVNANSLSLVETDPVANPRIDALNISKLNITDQRYNDTLSINILNASKGATGTNTGLMVVQNITNTTVQYTSINATGFLINWSNIITVFDKLWTGVSYLNWGNATHNVKQTYNATLTNFSILTFSPSYNTSVTTETCTGGALVNGYNYSVIEITGAGTTAVNGNYTLYQGNATDHCVFGLDNPTNIYLFNNSGTIYTIIQDIYNQWDLEQACVVRLYHTANFTSWDIDSGASNAPTSRFFNRTDGRTTDIVEMSYTGAGSVTDKRGEKFDMNQTGILNVVRKAPSVTATKAYIMDSGFNELASASFSGNEASFTIQLNQSQTYYAVVDAEGGNYDQAYKDTYTARYPLNRTYADYTSGYFSASDQADYAIMIESLDFSAVPQTPYSISTLPTNSYVRADGYSYFNPEYTNDFSLNFWYNGSVGNNKNIISKGGCNMWDGSGSDGWTLGKSDSSSSNSLIFWLCDGGNYAVRRCGGSPTINDNSKQMITVTWTGGSTQGSNIHIYFNGTECPSYDYTDQGGSISTIQNTNPITIGSNQGNSNYGPAMYDSLALYNEVISAQDMTDLYNSGNGTTTPPSGNLTEFYRFNEGTGTTITGDNSNTMTLYSSAEFSQGLVNDAGGALVCTNNTVETLHNGNRSVISSDNNKTIIGDTLNALYFPNLTGISSGTLCINNGTVYVKAGSCP